MIPGRSYHWLNTRFWCSSQSNPPYHSKALICQLWITFHRYPFISFRSYLQKLPHVWMHHNSLSEIGRKNSRTFRLIFQNSLTVSTLLHNKNVLSLNSAQFHPAPQIIVLAFSEPFAVLPYEIQSNRFVLTLLHSVSILIMLLFSFKFHLQSFIFHPALQHLPLWLSGHLAYVFQLCFLLSTVSFCDGNVRRLAVFVNNQFYSTYLYKKRIIHEKGLSPSSSLPSSSSSPSDMSRSSYRTLAWGCWVDPSSSSARSPSASSTS